MFNRIGKANAVVLAMAAAKLAIHLYAGRHYGYFVDELYYIACSKHLAWGYADQPPLIALLVWIARALFGDSLAALRLLPALAGAGEVAMTALIARELGGKAYAQGLAALALIIAPGVMAVGNIMSMNVFEPLFWLGCALLLIRIIKTGNHSLWIWFGIIAGIGLENKYSMLIFGAGIVVGLLLTPERRLLATPHVWIAGVIAALLFLPNVLWNIHEHFPFLEIQANIRRSGRDVALNPLSFFAEETLSMNPLTLPIWLAGLWFLFRAKQFRALAWAWVFTAAVIVTMSPRVYYLFPAYPLLFAGGAIFWETKPTWLKTAYAVLMVIGGCLLAPLALPVLPPLTYVAYTQTMHLAPPAIENHKLGPLPQLFADEFGWDEMAAEVGRVFHNLPADVQPKTAIFGQVYGQAGAIDFFGPKYGLPPAISGHQNYFLWGPRDYTGESVIVLDDRQSRLEKLFTSVEKVGHVEHPYSMPYEHFDVFYCRGLKGGTLKELWPKVKNWD